MPKPIRSSSANTSVGERYRDIRVMHRSFWLFSSQATRTNTKEPFMRLAISSFFWQTIADRTTDRIDSHRSSLDTFTFLRRLFWSHDICRTDTQVHRYSYRRGESVFSFVNSVRKHCLRHLQHPLCRNAHTHFIQIKSSSLTLVSFTVTIPRSAEVSVFLSKTDTDVMWDNEGDYIHVVQ